MHSRIGFIHGTGAALNIELGFVPDYVRLVNLTDGTKINEAFLGKIIAFTSGSLEIKAGDTIRGLTNTGVYAKVRQVILDSGSWAGGDAAGWLICNADEIVGTFGSENAEVNNSGNNDLGVSAQTELGVDTDTEVAGITGITSYVGNADSGFAKGFSIASGISTNGKLFGFEARRNGPGEGQDVKVAGVTQGAGVW